MTTDSINFKIDAESKKVMIILKTQEFNGLLVFYLMQ